MTVDIFKDKNILVGVTGSVAAYKACDLVSRLIDRGAYPKVVMTESAKKFVSPISFESLTGEPAITNLWRRTRNYRRTVHVSLAQSVCCAVIAPATANIIGKIRAGICDEILSCIICAFDKPVIIVPAMNDVMLKNPAVQENMDILKNRGVVFVQPVVGKLACGSVAQGKMADVDTIIETISNILETKIK